MSLLRTIKVAWEGLALHKGRSLLTTLGVIIGVAAVIVMLAVSAGAEAEIADQINTLGANLILVQPDYGRGGFGKDSGDRYGLSYGDVQAIAENVAGIHGVSAEQNTTQDVRGGDVTLTEISIVGTTPGFPAVREYQVASGRFLTQEDADQANRVAVLGAGIAGELFGGEAALGQRIKIGTTRFTVVGIMEEKGVVGNTDFDGRVYIPITVVFERFVAAKFGRDAVWLIYVSAADRADLGGVIAEVTALLNRRYDIDPAENAFTMMTQDSIIDAAASTTESFRNLLAWVAAVSLMVGGIGIMNIMLVSVTERTGEIGLRQALGARPRDVQLQFLFEAIILSLLGGLVGVFAGIGGSYLFGQLGTMRTEIVPLSIPVAFGAAALVGIFFGYYPAVKAAQLDPIEALRRD
ncbi:MAG: ABC transporter permease [Anaerolineae bacterium]|nr:ABC transporter permease [Anaerolineae bacterium]